MSELEQVWIIRRKSATIGSLIFLGIYVYYVIQTETGPRATFKLHDRLPSSEKSYIVNTSACKIPQFNPWDKSIQLLSTKCEPSDEEDPKCHERSSRNWMFIANGTFLTVNQTAILESGYSWGSIRCCYRVIIRVEQTLENYDKNADNVVRYSDKCTRISDPVTFMREEFFRVFCMSASIPLLNDVVYREYFAVPLLNADAQLRAERWRNSTKDSVPPSIVIVGVDTNSRLNSYRRFKKTLAVLREAGAVELRGYTKVGENTFPNTIAFLTGLNDSSFSQACYKSELEAQDNCPYLWKNFSRAGYLTGTIEDAPYSTGFNYMKTGFVKKPVDFYSRPFMLALMKQPRETEWFTKCVGSSSITETVFSYISKILEHGSNGAPVFLHTWQATFTHHCINGARFMDVPVSAFLKKFVDTNTILIFMGDHGDRFGKFRESTMGWYEDKLPTMWIYLPPKVREGFPEWERALKINSERLSSHFDLYQTFAQVLKTFTSEQVEEKFRTQGRSLLEPLPENRTCEDASIPHAYCACTEPINIDMRSESSDLVKVQQGANAAISFLDGILPVHCARPSLKQIVSAKVIRVSLTETRYIVSMFTDPGNFLFEVSLQEGGKDGELKVDSLEDMLRMNKILRKVSCVDNPDLERYCYCI